MNTKDACPVKQRPCQIPLAFGGGGEKHINKLLDAGMRVLQSGRPLQCWLGRGMALSDIV